VDDRVKSQAAGRHDGHDLHLVARFTAGDAGSGEASRARELLTACSACAALDVDLRAISAATRALAASGGSKPAPRDFRLSPADAVRARRRGPAAWSAALGSLAGLVRARGAAGLVALGLVGILVGTGVPGTFLGGTGAGGAAPESAATKDLAAPGPAFVPVASGADGIAATDLPLRTTQSAATAAPAAVAVTPGTETSLGAAAAAQPATDAPSTAEPAVPAPAATDAIAARTPSAPESTGSTLLIAASVVAIVVGFVLLVAGRRGRRAGP